MPCTQVDYEKIMKGRDEATQTYFTGQETLLINRHASEYIQVCRSQCINCNPKLSAEKMNYMTVSDDTHQGHALSLQNLIERKSLCIVCYGACLLSDEVHIASCGCPEPTQKCELQPRHDSPELHAAPSCPELQLASRCQERGRSGVPRPAHREGVWDCV